MPIPPASASGTPTIESTAYTRYYGTENVSDDGQVLTLDVLPVTTLTSIYDDLQRAFGSDTLVDSGAYTLLDGSAGKVWIVLSGSHGVWQQGEKNIKVAFTAGWATSPGNLIPPDLLEAHGLLAKVWFEQRGRIGLSSVPQGSGSASVRDPDSDIPIEIRHLLAPYKLPRELL